MVLDPRPRPGDAAPREVVVARKEAPLGPAAWFWQKMMMRWMVHETRLGATHDVRSHRFAAGDGPVEPPGVGAHSDFLRGHRRAVGRAPADVPRLARFACGLELRLF